MRVFANPICRHGLNMPTITARKVSKYWVFSDLYFTAFGLNTKRYWVSLRIQSEYGKIQTRKTSVFKPFSHSVYLRNGLQILLLILRESNRINYVLLLIRLNSLNIWRQSFTPYLIKFVISVLGISSIVEVIITSSGMPPPLSMNQRLRCSNQSNYK